MKATRKFIKLTELLEPCTEHKICISIRMEPETLSWFKSTGAGWQTRMNSVLRAYMHAKSST